MKQENKELLLKDLCARLPYETRVRYIYAFAGAVGISGYSDEGILSYDKLQNFSLPNVGYEKRRVDNILPYLRPMSNMSEDEKIELKEYLGAEEVGCDGFGYIEGGTLEDYVSRTPYSLCNYVIDWLNAHHFDFRGLIEKGLALEAPEGMYN